MRHFEIGQWVDMVRGVAGDRQMKEMQLHLGSGCKKCGRTVDMLRKVMSVAAAELEYEPPANAVEGARGIFALQQPEKVFIFSNVVGRLRSRPD